MDIPTRFNPKDIEERLYKFWEEKGYFQSKVNPEKEPFSIVIPPPNITGILHMGHALNNTIQDILVRYNRMMGRQTLWMPGTDHAGIATQNVVEKEIAKHNLKRQDLGRDKFLERVWQWREEYGSTIINQLKRLGCSCDWSRTRFTMDEEYSRAVIEVFVRLYQKGFIYKGQYIINWCPRCQTALSDEESQHREIDGYLYYIKYPFRKSETGVVPDYIAVATTRPETMLGDTAVAVNPKDRRYKKLIGKILILPLINREIRIISDDMVDKKFGTGAVKVTPAHDPNDYILGKKHSLDFVNIMHPDGRLNKNAGDYQGMDRFKAREAVLSDLKKKNLLEKVEPHKISAGHCYRCDTIIEPYLSLQWFVKMKPLAKPAIDVVRKGKIKFYPKRWTKVYLNWMENIQDWCISRQIWWGHRLPVYYCKTCQDQANQARARIARQKDTKELFTSECMIVSRTKPDNCPVCGSADITQDEDVLDTWFSSWLWPFATFGWPFSSHKLEKENLQPEAGSLQQRELDYFYPTSVLVTAPEILFFWVARMIVAGLEFIGDIPFHRVYIHGTVRDIRGKKMSKSLGNAIDPLEMISLYGTDALRFCLAYSASQGDLFLSKEKFEMGRNFANKIWNASRFVLMNLDSSMVKTDLCEFFKKENIRLVDRWILSRFYSMLKGVNRYLETYRFNEAANALYAFIWHEFCDWYLEISKNNLNQSSTQLIIYKVLEKTLRVLHPFMPFITDELWQRLPHEGESIMVQSWPHLQENIIDKKLEQDMQSVFELVRSIRNLRSQINLEEKQKAVAFIYPHAKVNLKLVKDNLDLIINLADLEELDVLGSSRRPDDTISDVIKAVDIYLEFRGLIDVEVQKNKIKEKISRNLKILETKNQRIKNKEFVKKAPNEVVEKEKQDIVEIENAIKRLEKMHNELH